MGLIAALSIISLSGTFAQNDKTEMRGLSAMEIADEMAPGINLFNTLDANATWISGLAIETAWGQPYTTFEMVESMANRGFKTLRIPVSWHNHMGDGPEYKIDKEWMDRVETVANYALDNGMYAIINIHHDDDYFVPTYAKQAEGEQWLHLIWTQIATRFKEYGDHLIFETMNEPREKGVSHEWSDGLPENRDVINAFVKKSVAAIRATGGNNSNRMVMIQQYGASPRPAKESLVYPEGDTCLMVSVHNYGPYNFCLNDNGTARWGTAAEMNAIRNEIKSYADDFEARGIPVIIGEWGAKDKNNYGDRLMYNNNFASACAEYGITPLLWMFSFDRKNLEWNSPLNELAIINAFDSTVVKAESVELNFSSDTLMVGDTIRLKATVFPETTTSKGVAWTSFKETVVAVDQSGLVTAKGVGSTTITATTIGKSTTCKLLVLDTIMDTHFHVESEDYRSQSGIQTEACSDLRAGDNVGYIQNGDWCSYTVNIDTTGTYLFTARTATDTNGGSIEIKANNILKGEATVDASHSNGWQDWFTTDPTEIKLYKGLYTIKLTFNGAGGYLFNLNWFELILKQESGTSIADHDYSGFKVFPNPASHFVNIKLPGAPATIELVDLNGRRIMLQESGDTEFQMDVSSLRKGIYILKVRSEKHCIAKTIQVE